MHSADDNPPARSNALRARHFGLTFALALMLTLVWPVFLAPSLAQGLDSADYAESVGTPDNPLEVKVGIKIDQITSVDQKSENYGAVVNLRLEWIDPALAFEPDGSGRDYRVFRPQSFLDYAEEKQTIVPFFVVQNQQSNRWIHQSLVVVFPQGRAHFFEKSSLTLQAPYFDFTRYPFDRQKFYFEIVSGYPSEFVRYVVDEEHSGLGELLGEEEWVLGNAVMETSTEAGLTGFPSAKVALGFEGHRHDMYYVTRIFTPMLVLIIVSWATFFLEEYRKRIEVAGANLLVFVAFNWMISDSLPKLGYLTFLDFILQWMFVITGAVIIVNVALRWLKINGREPLARKIDNYVIKWVYPLAYVGIVGFAITRFLYIG